MTVGLPNLPGVKAYKNDGNLIPEAAARAPRVMVIGTAGSGLADDAFIMTTTALAKAEFGTDGTLLRGMWEALKGGAEEVVLYRIGATPASVTGIGDTTGAAGYTVTTIEQDASSGVNYALYYDDSADRLVVRRNSDNLVIYDNDATSPIDYDEVVVSGYRATGGGGDIGSPSAFVNFELIIDATYTGTSYTAGTDGVELSRMEMYQELYKAYKNAVQTDFDVLVPMDVYLDDYNVNAQGHYLGAIDPVVPGGSTFPTRGAYQPGTDVDALGRVYVEEYEGQFYFWWWFDDGDGTFSAADITPADVPGSGSSSAQIDGTALTAADFHEVNFAYQLARFLYDYSTNIVDATGTIGVLPPASTSFQDRARWLGADPTWTLDTGTGEYSIASAANNGSGLLGNKFMVGRNTYRSGVFGGGFVATDTLFMDGTELVDDNEIAVDLGKYISVVADTPILRNNWYSAGYRATFAPSYAGFYIGMDPSSAPTNKKVKSAQIVYKQSLENLDSLVGAGYVVMRQKSTGLVVADAPTASLPGSDWIRLSTVRIVKAVIDGVRAAADRFIGEGVSQAARASLQNEVEKVLMDAKKAGYLQDFRPFTITQTPAMEVAGRAEINLTLIPAFELRQIEVTVSLSRAA